MEEKEISLEAEKKVTNYFSLGKSIIYFILIGIIGLIFSSMIIPMLSAFPAILGNVGFGLLVIYIIDKYVFKDIDTIEEIKKGNIAYSIIILAFALIIMASILAT